VVITFLYNAKLFVNPVSIENKHKDQTQDKDGEKTPASQALSQI
jgi:hypothetical protein